LKLLSERKFVGNVEAVGGSPRATKETIEKRSVY
jgi:hypothetical protein